MAGVGVPTSSALVAAAQPERRRWAAPGPIRIPSSQGLSSVEQRRAFKPRAAERRSNDVDIIRSNCTKRSPLPGWT